VQIDKPEQWKEKLLEKLEKDTLEQVGHHSIPEYPIVPYSTLTSRSASAAVVCASKQHRGGAACRGT
jgi:hypothetical protein